MTARTYLLIANETLGGSELRRVIDDRLAAGPAHFHVVVPATRHRGLMAQTIDAYAGEPAAYELDEEHADAATRLDRELDRLRLLGADVDGAVGDADPIQAAEKVLENQTFDEVILSTLPAGASHWLGMDLPSRLERALGRSITHVEGPPPSP